MRFPWGLKTGWLTLILLLSACAPAVTLTPGTPAPLPASPIPARTAAIAVSRIAIRAVTVIDVERGIAVPGQTVIVVGDRIDQIEAHAKRSLPPGARVIDGHGLYLMPALEPLQVNVALYTLVG